jgi:DNA topoisomerase I
LIFWENAQKSMKTGNNGGILAKSNDRKLKLMISDKKLSATAVKEEVIEVARAAGLVYVSDRQPGFTRKKRGKTFHYFDGNQRLTDPGHLERIRKLVLPPAWQKVWICKKPKGHLQATGLDKMGRKQYKYHKQWLELRNQTKFSRLLEFGGKLPLIRQNLDRDLSSAGLNQRKVLAAVVSLLERVNIRIGSSFYEKLYGSFGLTTLKNRHVKINGSELNLSFKGKRGVRQVMTFKSRKLANIIKKCKEIPGQELFEYYDHEGNIRTVDSGMVNQYIREISQGDFTAKDFRTWAGSVNALLALKQTGGFDTVAEMNRKIPAALDIVAKELGNTRAICKKYYVHPYILELYQDKKLDQYLVALDHAENKDNKHDYVSEEKVLLNILESVELQNETITKKQRK